MHFRLEFRVVPVRVKINPCRSKLITEIPITIGTIPVRQADQSGPSTWVVPGSLDQNHQQENLL